ncbi:MAG: MarR family transcriptional regulator [Novosphingobium sp.]|nr:MarR family transcriptional regulator [Novosphingobium sp.]
MLEVGSAEHVLKAAEIQPALRFTARGVTRRLDSMAAKGLIERVPDPSDGRAWLGRLTAEGRRIIRIPLSVDVGRNHRVEEAFTVEEWHDLTRQLERLATVLTNT